MGKKTAISQQVEVSDEDDSFDQMEFAAISDVQDTIKRRITDVKRHFANNTNGLLQAYQSIALPKDWPWIETISVTSFEPIQVEDINDDLKLEASFYQASTAAAKQAILQLEQSGVPYKRPEDFYAESVKPDAHMAKIKQILLNDKKKIDDVELRKRQRDQKKFSKAVKSERVKARASDKRKVLEEISRLKSKSRNNDKSSREYKSAIRKNSHM